jgi:hypothetical protein
MHDGTDGERGDHNETHREQQDGSQRVLEGGDGRVQRRHVQQRRQDADQHQLGIEVHLRDTGHERQPEPGDQQHERRHEPEPAGERGSEHRDRDQRDRLEDALHARKLKARPRRAGVTAPTPVGGAPSAGTQRE